MYEDFFPERLSKLRTQKCVSARDMSLSLGQSENYINMIENKKSFPSMSVFFNICEYLRITPQEFFETGNDNPEKLHGIIANLKRLDDTALSNIEGIIKVLADK